MGKRNRYTTQSGKELHPWDTYKQWVFIVMPEERINIAFARRANPALKSETIMSDMLSSVTQGCYATMDRNGAKSARRSAIG